MVFGESVRRKLKFLLTTEPPKVHEWGELLAAALDNDVEGGQGTLAERPAAKLRGRVYMVQGDATEANNGILWWDTGATWVKVKRDARNWTAPAGVTVNSEHEVSAEHETEVAVTLKMSAGAFLKVFVNGTQIAEWVPGTGSESTATVTFGLPAAQKYKVEVTNGVVTATASTRIVN